MNAPHCPSCGDQGQYECPSCVETGSSDGCPICQGAGVLTCDGCKGYSARIVLVERERALHVADVERLRAEVERLTQERDEARAANGCDSCTGGGRALDGGPCMCGGSGLMSRAALYLRERLVEREREMDALQRAANVRLLEERDRLLRDRTDTVGTLRSQASDASRAIAESQATIMRLWEALLGIAGGDCRYPDGDAMSPERRAELALAESPPRAALDAALAAERDACARAVCIDCAHGRPYRRDEHGSWAHDVDGRRAGCSAYAIRNKETR